MKLKEAKEILVTEGYEVKDKVIIKNGKELDSLVVGTGLYSPSIYESTVEGLTTSDELISLINKAMLVFPDVDADCFTSSEFYYENAISCIRHRTNDESILKYPVLGDLEEYIRVMLPDSDSRSLSIVITNEMVDRLNLDTEYLHTVARAHLREHVNIKNMSDIISDMVGIPSEELNPGPESLMYVVSTDNNIFGGAAILLEDFLKDFAKSKNCKKLCIIPSSIHELILIPSDVEDYEMDSMIDEVNSSVVEEDERLSNHCYFIEA